MRRAFTLRALIWVIVIVVISAVIYLTSTTSGRASIEAVYSGDSFIAVDNASKGPMYNLTYGEITEEGIRSIIGYLKETRAPISTFIDLGCGNGRSLVYAIKSGFSKAKGAEIVDERYQFAIRAMAKLPEYRSAIEILHADFFHLPREFFPPNSTIFVSNLLFPLETSERLLQFLSDNTTGDVTLVVSKLPANLHKYRLDKSIDVPMSWQKASTCYVLKKSGRVNTGP